MISWRRSDENNVSNWQSARVTEEQFEILNIAENGQYDIQLYAVSFSGKKTDIISTVYRERYDDAAVLSYLSDGRW